MSTEETDTVANVAENGATVVLEKAPSKRGTSKKKGAPKGQKTAKGGRAKAAPKKQAKTSKKPARAKGAAKPRAESKGAKILDLVGRPKGATLAEIMKVTDWQAHSVRGYLSTAAKKHSLKIESSKIEAGERLYKIKK
jgi:hypothetical protein